MSEDNINTSSIEKCCDVIEIVEQEPSCSKTKDITKIPKKIVKKSMVQDKKLTKKLNELLTTFNISEKQLCMKLKKLKQKKSTKRRVNVASRILNNRTAVKRSKKVTKTSKSSKHNQQNISSSSKDETLVISTTRNEAIDISDNSQNSNIFENTSTSTNIENETINDKSTNVDENCDTDISSEFSLQIHNLNNSDSSDILINEDSQDIHESVTSADFSLQINDFDDSESSNMLEYLEEKQNLINEETKFESIDSNLKNSLTNCVNLISSEEYDKNIINDEETNKLIEKVEPLNSSVNSNKEKSSEINNPKPKEIDKLKDILSQQNVSTSDCQNSKQKSLSNNSTTSNIHDIRVCCSSIESETSSASNLQLNMSDNKEDISPHTSNVVKIIENFTKINEEKCEIMFDPILKKRVEETNDNAKNNKTDKINKILSDGHCFVNEINYVKQNLDSETCKTSRYLPSVLLEDIRKNTKYFYNKIFSTETINDVNSKEQIIEINKSLRNVNTVIDNSTVMTQENNIIRYQDTREISEVNCGSFSGNRAINTDIKEHEENLVSEQISLNFNSSCENEKNLLENIISSKGKNLEVLCKENLPESNTMIEKQNKIFGNKSLQVLSGRNEEKLVGNNMESFKKRDQNPKDVIQDILSQNIEENVTKLNTKSIEKLADNSKDVVLEVLSQEKEEYRPRLNNKSFEKEGKILINIGSEVSSQEKDILISRVNMKSLEQRALNSNDVSPDVLGQENEKNIFKLNITSIGKEAQNSTNISSEVLSQEKEELPPELDMKTFKKEAQNPADVSSEVLSQENEKIIFKLNIKSIEKDALNLTDVSPEILSQKNEENISKLNIKSIEKESQNSTDVSLVVLSQGNEGNFSELNTKSFENVAENTDVLVVKDEKNEETSSEINTKSFEKGAENSTNVKPEVSSQEKKETLSGLNTKLLGKEAETPMDVSLEVSSQENEENPLEVKTVEKHAQNLTDVIPEVLNQENKENSLETNAKLFEKVAQSSRDVNPNVLSQENEDNISKLNIKSIEKETETLTDIRKKVSSQEKEETPFELNMKLFEKGIENPTNVSPDISSQGNEKTSLASKAKTVEKEVQNSIEITQEVLNQENKENPLESNTKLSEKEAQNPMDGSLDVLGQENEETSLEFIVKTFEKEVLNSIEVSPEVLVQEHEENITTFNIKPNEKIIKNCPDVLSQENRENFCELNMKSFEKENPFESNAKTIEKEAQNSIEVSQEVLNQENEVHSFESNIKLSEEEAENPMDGSPDVLGQENEENSLKFKVKTFEKEVLNLTEVSSAILGQEHEENISKVNIKPIEKITQNCPDVLSQENRGNFCELNTKSFEKETENTGGISPEVSSKEKGEIPSELNTKLFEKKSENLLDVRAEVSSQEKEETPSELNMTSLEKEAEYLTDVNADISSQDNKENPRESNAKMVEKEEQNSTDVSREILNQENEKNCLESFEKELPNPMDVSSEVLRQENEEKLHESKAKTVEKETLNSTDVNPDVFNQEKEENPSELITKSFERESQNSTDLSPEVSSRENEKTLFQSNIKMDEKEAQNSTDISPEVMSQEIEESLLELNIKSFEKEAKNPSDISSQEKEKNRSELNKVLFEKEVLNSTAVSSGILGSENVENTSELNKKWFEKEALNSTVVSPEVLIQENEVNITRLNIKSIGKEAQNSTIIRPEVLNQENDEDPPGSITKSFDKEAQIPTEENSEISSQENEKNSSFEKDSQNLMDVSTEFKSMENEENLQRLHTKSLEKKVQILTDVDPEVTSKENEEKLPSLNTKSLVKNVEIPTDSNPEVTTKENEENFPNFNTKLLGTKSPDVTSTGNEEKSAKLNTKSLEKDVEILTDSSLEVMTKENKEKLPRLNTKLLEEEVKILTNINPEVRSTENDEKLAELNTKSLEKNVEILTDSSSKFVSKDNEEKLPRLNTKLLEKNVQILTDVSSQVTSMENEETLAELHTKSLEKNVEISTDVSPEVTCKKHKEKLSELNTKIIQKEVQILTSVGLKNEKNLSQLNIKLYERENQHPNNTSLKVSCLENEEILSKLNTKSFETETQNQKEVSSEKHEQNQVNITEVNEKEDRNSMEENSDITHQNSENSENSENEKANTSTVSHAFLSQHASSSSANIALSSTCKRNVINVAKDGSTEEDSTEEDTSESLSQNSQTDLDSPEIVKPFFQKLENNDDIRDKIRLQLNLLRSNRKIINKDDTQPSTSRKTDRIRIIEKEKVTTKINSNEKSIEISKIDTEKNDEKENNNRDINTDKQVSLNTDKTGTEKMDCENMDSKIITRDLNKEKVDRKETTNLDDNVNLKEVLLTNEKESDNLIIIEGCDSNSSKSRSKKLNNLSIIDILLQKKLSYEIKEQAPKIYININAIKPTKTRDIRKIKGWRSKLFNVPETDKIIEKIENVKMELDEPIKISATKETDQNIIPAYINLNQPSTSKFRPEQAPISHKKEEINEETEDRIEKKLLTEIKSAFVSDVLDDFLNNDTELKISYEVPKLNAEDAISKLSDFPISPIVEEPEYIRPVRPKKQETSGIKPKTLAEKRRLLELERKSKTLNSYAVSETYLNNLKNETGNKNIIHHFIRENIPFSKNCWALAMKNETCQYVTYNNLKIKIAGSYGTGTMKVTNPINKYTTDIKEMKKMKSIVNKNYKPGPLSKKRIFLKSINKDSEYEILKMPKIKLVLYPEFGKKIPFIAEQYLSLCKNDSGLITEEFAKLAVSAVKTENKTIDEIEFNIPYSHNQNKILLRKVLIKQNDIVVDKYPDIEVDSEIKNIMSGILDAIENQNLDKTIIKEDPDLNLLQNSPEKKKKIVSKIDYDDNDLSSAIIKQRNHKKSKTTLELRRLNVQVIEVDVEDAPKIEKTHCLEDFCKMGCVCNSLLGTGNSIPEHCGREQCMFKCTCSDITQTNKHSVKLPAGTDLLSASTMVRLKDEAVKHLAKEEKLFTQTVIKANNQTIVVGGGTREKRRIPKPPKKFNDYIKTTDELINNQMTPEPVVKEPSVQHPEPVFTRKTVPIWKNVENNEIKEIKKIQCFVKVEMLNLKNVLPWCMIHNLYKCYCGGKIEPPKELFPKPKKVETEDYGDYITYAPRYSSKKILKEKETESKCARTHFIKQSEYYLSRNKTKPYQVQYEEIRKQEKGKNEVKPETRGRKKIVLENDESLVRLSRKRAPIEVDNPLPPRKKSRNSTESVENISVPRTRSTRKKERVSYVQESSDENEDIPEKQSIKIRITSDTNTNSPKLVPLFTVADVNENASTENRRNSSEIKTYSTKSTSHKTETKRNLIDSKIKLNDAKKNLFASKSYTRTSENNKKDLLPKKNISPPKDFPMKKIISTTPNRQEISKSEVTLPSTNKEISLNTKKTNENQPNTKTSFETCEGTKQSSLINYKKSFNGLIIPTEEWLERFRNMLNIAKEKKCQIRLLQWAVLVRRFRNNMIQIWANSKNDFSNIVLTENKRRPSRFHLNIKVFSEAIVTDFKVPSIVNCLINDKLPGRGKNEKEIYVMLVNYGFDWEIRGTVVLNTIQTMIEKELSHRPVPSTILFKFLDESPKAPSYTYPRYKQMCLAPKAIEIRKIPLQTPIILKDKDEQKNLIKGNDKKQQNKETNNTNKLSDLKENSGKTKENDNITEINGIIFSSNSMVIEKVDTNNDIETCKNDGNVQIIETTQIEDMNNLIPNVHTRELSVSNMLTNLPLSTDAGKLHWFILKLENDFSILKITSTNFVIKYTHITSAIQMARKNQRTVRIRPPDHSNKHHISFGIYAVHEFNDRIFFGPYLSNKDHFLNTFRYANGKLVSTKAYNAMQGYPAAPCSGKWVLQTHDFLTIINQAEKLDDLKSLEAWKNDIEDKPKIEFVDLTENDSEDEEIETTTDPLYNVLAADFSKHTAGDVTIEKLPKNSTMPETRTKIIMPDVIATKVNKRKADLEANSSSTKLSVVLQRSKDPKKPTKIIKRIFNQKILPSNLDLKIQDGNTPAVLTNQSRQIISLDKFDIKIKDILPSCKILTPPVLESIDPKISEMDVKRTVPPLYPLNYKSDENEGTQEKKLVVSPKMTSILKPMQSVYIISMIPDFGYIDVIHGDDYYQVPGFGSTSPKKFKDIYLAIQWLASYFKEKICHVPSYLQLGLCVWQNKEPPDMKKFNEDCLKGLHIVCNRGLFSVFNLRAKEMKASGFKDKEIQDVLHQKFQILLKKNIKIYGNTVHETENEPMEDTDILNRLNAKEANLIEVKKKLLANQKLAVNKLNKLLADVPEFIEEKVKANVGNILTKNYSKVEINTNNSVKKKQTIKKTVVPAGNSATESVKSTENVQSVKFKLMNGYFVPVNISSDTNSNENINNTENSRKKIKLSNASEIVDLTDS